MQKIIIKNFGPIEYAEIEVSKIVVLIGEQASGKSTISKLIYFFKSLKEDFLMSIYQSLNTEEDSMSFFAQSIRSKFYLFFGSTHNLPAFSIEFYYSNGNDKKIGVYKREKDPSSVSFSIPKKFTRSVDEELKEVIIKLKKLPTQDGSYNFAIGRFEESKNLGVLASLIDGLFEDDRTPLYVPAGRNITVSYSNQFRLLFYGDLSKILEGTNQKRYSSEHSADMHLMKKYFEAIEGLLDKFENFLKYINFFI